YVLAREHEHGGRVVSLDGHLPRTAGLVGVARAQHDDPRNGAQVGELLHRLVRRPVLADADAVVCIDPDGAQPGDRRQPDWRSHVIGEDQERRAERDEATVIDEAIDDRAHGMLADAKMDVAPRVPPTAADGPLDALALPRRRLEVA